MNILERISLKTDLKIAQLERELGFGNGTMGRWNNSSPSLDKATALADYLNVSLDYLAGREQKQEPATIPNANKNPEIQQIIHKLNTIEIPDDVIEFINNALDAYRK